MSQEAVAAWKNTIIPHPVSTYTLKGILNIAQNVLIIHMICFLTKRTHSKKNVSKGKKVPVC